MKHTLSTAEILQSTHAQRRELNSDVSFSGHNISTDTRTIGSGDLFIPLKGENFDGHRFITRAIEQGASLAFCEIDYYEAHKEQLKTYPLALVHNTLKAYQDIARLWREKLNPKVIAITGSSGKTSTKEILGALLSHFGSVHKTTLNFNNEIGVPKTILELSPDHQFCILEMGMRAKGEIRELAQIAKPDIGIITNIGQAHVGELGSVENIARAKWELAEVLDELNGTCVLLSADIHLRNCAKLNPELNIIWCGADQHIQCLDKQNNNLNQKVVYQINESPAQTLLFNLPGLHQINNLLLCLGVLFRLDLTLPEQYKLNVPTIFGRNELLSTPEGVKILNDAYNANPDSMKATLNMFCQHYEGKKMAVLSTMGELGSQSHSFHKEIGEFCKGLPLDYLLVIGSEAKGIFEGAQDGNFKLIFCEDQQQALNELNQLKTQVHIILFKASRSARLENIFNQLIKHE